MSALVISGNLLLLSAFIAGNVVEPNPFALMSGLFILPLCISMAAQQYRGTFRGVPSAATTASVLLYVFAGFLLFGVITSTGEAVLQGSSLHLMAPFLIPMLVAAALCVAFGRMNALWSRKLREGLASGVISPVQRGFSLRELLLAVGVVAALTGITSQFIESAPPWYAKNIDPSAAPFRLPSGATDVSYCKGYRGTITYEFTIDEQAFRDWVRSGIGSIESESAGVPLREITSPFTITRYHAYSSELNGPDDITVANGLFYSWSKFEFCTYFDHQARLARGDLKAVMLTFAQPLQGRCLSASQAEYPGNLVKDFFRATAFRNSITEIVLPAQTPQCR
jgi:hypothetical protein